MLPPSPAPTVLSNTDFEADLGDFTDGGADAARYLNAVFSAERALQRQAARRQRRRVVDLQHDRARGRRATPRCASSTSALAIGMEADEGYCGRDPA